MAADTILWQPSTATTSYPTGVRPTHDRGDFITGRATVTLGSSATYLRGHFTVAWQNRDQDLLGHYSYVSCVTTEPQSEPTCDTAINENNKASGTELPYAYSVRVLDPAENIPEPTLAGLTRSTPILAGIGYRWSMWFWYDRFTAANKPPTGTNARFTQRFFSGWGTYQYWYPDPSQWNFPDAQVQTGYV